MEPSPSSPSPVDRVIERFWETIPPFWGEVRAHIRAVAAERFELTVEQFHILRHIHRGNRSVSELADVKQISRAAVSQAVDALVVKGLVERAQNPDDRRHVFLTLTENGQELLEAIFWDTSQWMKQYFATLDEDEMSRLMDGMEMIRKVLHKGIR